MAQSLPSLAAVHVVVAGDVMIDRYWYGRTERVSQEAPVPIVQIDATEDRPGGAANVALNVVALGARCTLIGAVGADDGARRLRETLEAAGVVCDFVVVDGVETMVKLRVVSKRQQLLRTDFEPALPGHVAAEVAERFARRAAAADAAVLSDYDKGAIGDPGVLLQSAAAHSVPVIADPKHKPLARYAGAYLLKPNRTEFTHAVGGWADDSGLVAKATALLESIDVAALVITRGDEGATLVRADGRYRHLPASPIDVYDVTGAGDTVAAVLGAATALRWDPEEGVRTANVAAGIACTRSGTVAVTGVEVNQAIARMRRSDLGVLTREQLIAAVARAREQGERIVFTNGCFDILHAGHVGYLDEARALGDRLVVAVNDDASAARLKGPGRPVNRLARRMRVLEGLAAVDWVVAFSEDTPEPLLEAVRPDVLVKGGDYTQAEVVGAGIVEGYGGEVRVLSLVEDCSTTEIVDRIRSV